MNRFIIITLFGWLLLVSCDDFLSKNPDNRANLSTPENIAGLLVSAYPEYSHVWFTELMSDNATDVGPTAGEDEVWVRQAYYWEKVNSEEQDSPDGYWYSCYKAISAANHALDAIEKLEKENTYKQSELNPMKGEALLCRAYAHFMLLNLFAEHYNPATAASTSGIPYVTKPETKPYTDYVRQSVAEVYALIENDITTGFPLIKDELFEAPKWHFNRQAAATFISRYYLYRGLSVDWDKVLYYAGLAVENNPADYLRDWLTTSDQSFDVFGTNYSRSGNIANFLITGSVSAACRAWYYRYSMDLNLIRKRVIYGAPHPTSSDISNNFVFSSKAGGNSELRCYSVFKYVEVFKRDGVNANYGTSYVMNTPFVAEEALFNQMEAEVMKENYNKVIELLDVYYSTRVIDYSSSKHKVTDATIRKIYAGTQTSPDVKPHFNLNEKQMIYLKCIINIRATEFVTDGQRWFDIKRMHLPVTHAIYQGESFTLTSDDERRVIPLPQDAGNIPFTPENNLVPQAPNITVTPLME
ncbi:hypothetical protein FACS1894123_10800 [Bacteroidia bacterium]|nr:hypothetical protein FACS1894123_10800 [Bacteroidia bacterium]